MPPVPDKSKLDLTVRGSTGLPVWGGRVYDEPLFELQGDRGRRIYREMSEQDPIIGGTLFGIEMLSRQVEWTIKPADQTAKADDIAQFIDECLTDMNPVWEETLSEILSMLVYGWSWLEMIYKRREGPDDSELKTSHFTDGKIGWAAWSLRGQDTLQKWLWTDNDKGQVTDMVQWEPNGTENVIPRSKSLHFKTRSRRENPEGVSILRNSYRPWYMKKNIEVIEGIGIERDLAGMPVIWAPQELFAKDAEAGEKALYDHLQKIVTSIKRDEQEGILMPMAYDADGKNPLYKLELLSTAGDRQFDTNGIIGRYDERIAMSMLADFILMGHSAVGSFALSTTKTGMFSTALGAILDGITAEINAHAIPKLVKLNGWPLTKTPALQHGQIEAADMGKLGAFLKALADSGMQVFPNAKLETYVLEQAGLPSSQDEGAGEFPTIVPNADPNATPQPQLVQITPVPTPGGAPGAAPTPIAGAKPKPRPKSRSVSPTTQSRPQSATGSRIAAGERKPPRFINLATRVARATPVLKERLGDNFALFTAAAMKAGKFSALPRDLQVDLLEAEE